MFVLRSEVLSCVACHVYAALIGASLTSQHRREDFRTDTWLSNSDSSLTASYSVAQRLVGQHSFGVLAGE